MGILLISTIGPPYSVHGCNIVQEGLTLRRAGRDRWIGVGPPSSRPPVSGCSSGRRRSRSIWLQD